MEVFAFLTTLWLYIQHHSTLFNIVQLNIQHHPLNHPLNPPSILFGGFPLKIFKAHSCHRFSTVFSPAWLRDQRKGASARQLASGLGNGWTWWDGGMLVFCSWKFMESDEILNFPKPPCNCHSNQGALAEWSRIETWRLSSLGHVKTCPTRTLETQAFRPSPLSHGLRTAQENMQKHTTHSTHSTHSAM